MMNLFHDLYKVIRLQSTGLSCE